MVSIALIFITLYLGEDHLIVFLDKVDQENGFYNRIHLAIFSPSIYAGCHDAQTQSRVRIHLTERSKFASTKFHWSVPILSGTPALRALRIFWILRVLRFVRSSAVFQEKQSILWSHWRLYHGPTALCVWFWYIDIHRPGGVSIYMAEHHVTNIETLGDGFWWALVTLTTVDMETSHPSPWLVSCRNVDDSGCSPLTYFHCCSNPTIICGDLRRAISNEQHHETPHHLWIFFQSPFITGYFARRTTLIKIIFAHLSDRQISPSTLNGLWEIPPKNMN